MTCVINESWVKDGEDGRDSARWTGHVRDGASVDYITSALKDEILSGELQPGSRLGQETLAERFKASRMPVREALRLLEAEGLVTVVPRSGAWVSKLDAFEFEKTYRLRSVVEPFALEESVPLLNESDIEYLAEVCDELQTVSSSPLDIERFLALDREFHMVTYRGVEHRQLQEIVDRMWNTTQNFRRILLHRLGEKEIFATQRDHELILDSIRRRDAEAASKLMWVHLRRTHQTLDSLRGLFD